MVVSDASIHNIMGGMESTAGVRLHNHRRKLKQRFDIIKKLGQGTYGKVQLGINKETGQEVAIKTIKKAKIETEADLVRIRREIQIMSSVQHPNIIHIYEVFENREKMVLVMEYAAGGELYDFLSERKVLAEEEARRIFRQIATAVYYCHKHKICHRDLKLENILLDEYGSAKIADFGLSNVFDEQRLLNTFCGSPLYASPEIVKGTPYHGPEVDCWSLGVLLYTLVYGAMPFDGSNFKRLVKQISQGDYFEPKKPSPASPLIREMLTVTPARRADIEKICSHWWVNEGHTDLCLDIAEELANQTPVRLDLLLSLAPPPPAVGSDKMLLTDEQGQGDSRAIVADQLGPPRCHSVGSLMELDQPSTERRIREFEKKKRRGSGGDAKDAPKRKLEEGISAEDAVQGGAKRKECLGKWEHCVDQNQSTVRSSNQSTQASDTKENKQSISAAEEKMDIDMDIEIPEPVSSEISKETSEPPAVNGETLRNETPVVLDSAESGVADTMTQKTSQKDPTKKTVAGDRMGRKSVKGSMKKSKPSVDSVPTNTETAITKDVEPKPKTTQTEVEGTKAEKNTEETPTAAHLLSSESNKTKEGTGEPPVEAVKPKVKKKKVPNSNKSEDTSLENSQNSAGAVDVVESSLKATDKSNLDESSSLLKKEVGDTKINSSSDKISKNSLSSKDSSESKTSGMSKTSGVKTKKIRGDLSLGKLSSGTDKSSKGDELASPTKPVERRRSKIFENGDKFNIFLSGSDSKLPTTEKPKKVFIPGVKVSDYKQAFERRSSLTSTLPVPIKNSSSKKAVGQNSKLFTKKSSSCDSDNVDTPRAVKDVGKSSDVSELITESDVNTPKHLEDSQSLKKEETLPESSRENQLSMESSASQTDAICSLEQSTKPNKEESNECKSMNPENTVTSATAKDEEADLKLVPALHMTDKVFQQEKARIKKLKDAVEIISNAIAEESKRESDSAAVKKISAAKPPVPISPDKPKTMSAGNSNSSSPKSPPMSPTDASSGKMTIQVQIAPNDVRLATVQVSTPQNSNFPFDDTSVSKLSADKSSETPLGKQHANEDTGNVYKEEDTTETKQVETSQDITLPAMKKSAKVEITLKSATLPRRRTSKAEIQLGFPPATGAPGEYRTEVEHMVGSIAPSRLQTQRSEVAFPVAAATNVKPLTFRSSSLEPEGTPSSRSKPREHIIPIRMEQNADENSPLSSPPPAKPPVPCVQQQRSVSQRSSSLSRQSTQDSDTDSTISVPGPEPIRKSPREYIIPIAVEGGGYITPRAGSLEPSVSDVSTEASRHHHRSSGRFNIPRRMSSLLSDSGASEDEGFNSLSSPFATLQRHSSLGKDDPDDERSFHHMHRLRSSRPNRRTPLEHNDSLSSAEEDDDDDGFEILTAESLFSTLLSRVRSLTQRLNVEDGGRPGFPSSRLLSHIAPSGRASPSSGFWSNVYSRQGEPLSRRISESSQFLRPFGHDGKGTAPWRRSVSRDVSDGDSVYSETTNSMTGGGTLPRGLSRFDCENVSDDVESELNSSHYCAPSMAQRMHCHWHSPSREVGNQSTMIRQISSSDCLAPKRNSSLCSLTSQDSNIPQHTSRRLSRTLSLRSTADERSNSNVSRNHDSHYRKNHLLSCSTFGDQEEKHSNENFTSYLHRQDYMPDTQESFRAHTRKDYLPSTRRALSSLDSKGRTIGSMSTNRGNSATSDGDVNSKALDLDRVLPPLPYNAGSQGQRREAGRSSSSTRRCSMDMTGGPYGNHLNGSSHNLQHSSIQEEVAYDRPHHSSSLPSMAKTKEKKSVSSYGGKPSDKVNTELKNSFDHGVGSYYSSYLNPKSISYVSTMPSQLNNSRFKSVENSSSVLESLPGFRSKLQDKLLRKNNTNETSSSVSKGHSQIPSLLNFHSPSANTYAIEKQRNKDYPLNVEEGANCVRKPQSSSLLRCTPDRSILSKFFRQGPEEKDVTHEVESANGDKDAAKKKRRISRFLRPDFFDTPREESIYAKEKDAKKAAEAENKLRLRRNLKQLVAENNGSQSQLQKPKEIGLSLLTEEILKTDPVSASSDNINTDKDNINLMNSSRSEMEQTGEEKESGEQKKSANDMREKPDNISDIKKPEKRCLAFEKQPNNVTNKNRFLHSLEKKLEKFRSSVDSTPSTNGCGKSRVDKAICSLREQSLTPRSGDVITSESHLLKRAVSVSDCCTVESSSKSNVPSKKESASSKLGNKVTSVLGLFRKLEDAPSKTHQSSSPRPSVLSRQKRTQSVYGGSHSDSVLLEPGGLEFRSVPPLHLKKTNSNSSVIKRNSLQRDETIQKEDLEKSKIIESQLEDPRLKKLENKATRLTAELTTDNMLGSETTIHNSNIAHDRNVLEGSHATKQQESSVPKLLKRESIKSKTKNSVETGSKTQPKNFSDIDSCTRSASVVEQSKSCKDQANIRSELEGNIKSVRPGSLTGLKSVIPDNVMKVPDAADTSVAKKFLMSADTNECVRLMTQEAETENSKDNLDGNKNVYVRRKSAGEVSCNSCADAHKSDELKSCTVSEVPPTMDDVFDNSPVDNYSLNDDEVKFANVKRLDSCLYPANDSSVLSPADESESFDSWSVCSDFESHEYPSSPVPLPGDDIEESVGDRIRRKSFYSRFNDIKKKHKKPPLSSISSLSFSYRDPSSVSFLHPPRNFMRKKDHPADCLLHSSHSIYYPLKSHRSQSLYAQNDYDRLPPCSGNSPVLSRLQYSSLTESNAKPLVTKNVTCDRNGNVDDFLLIGKSDVWDDSQKASVSVDEVLQTTSTVRENIPFLGGSVENLRMPRHFNHNVNFSTLPYQSLYSDTMIKASDSHLSRSNESGIGATIPKSCLPAVLDRHLSLPPRFDSNNSSVAVTSCPGSAVRSASVTGETSPLHGKYKRHNSYSLLNVPSSVCNGSPTAAGEDLYMESELPVTPDCVS